ncbi:GlpG protein [Pasteurella langaaensis DSM 22999]|uniref:GlpG protein n=1 Tax=Alitibacter langaaensis DSM 22999 TaxID=1122935 RepID=A0A2U0SL64_9PAST|nr:rhomboid family intramembrane serine protease [Pasteurella langaaensis]PVX32104.1 GlpG protein [Pasteurella langaaensis DSM 22999]
MQCLIRSHIPQFIMSFRDYIRSKYAVDLKLVEEMNAQGEPKLCAYLDENSPHFAAITHEAKIFLQNPFDERYQQASWESGDTKSVQYQYQKPNFYGYLLRWSQTKFTVFLTALCAIIFAFEWFGYDESIMTFAHYPADIGEDHEIWRYFSHALVHLSPLHILFNLAWWWIFAGMIERHFGSLKLIGLFFLSAVVSGMVQNWASGPAFFGLSGVVYAVMGFVFMVDKFGSTKATVLPEGFFTMLVVGIAFGFVSPFIGIEMGNAAHISGLIVGLICGFLQAKVRSN